MSARTRVEAADAVVSVQAEGVDQASKKIKEVDQALNKLPAAAKAADAATADSAKRWQELAGKVGAAVGAFASVQSMNLSTNEGLVGLAGVAAMATAALGPLGLAVTAVAAAVNIYAASAEEGAEGSTLFADTLTGVREAADNARAGIDALTKSTGGYLSTLDPARQVEYLGLLDEENKLAAQSAELTARMTAKLAEHQALQASYGRTVSADALAFLVEQETATQRLLDARRAEIALRREDLDLLAKNNAEVRGLTASVEEQAKAVRVATEASAAWQGLVAALRDVRAENSLLLDELTARQQVETDAASTQRKEAEDLILWQENQAAGEREAAAEATAREKAQLKDLGDALRDFYEQKAEMRQADLDRTMAVNAAALSAAEGVAGVFGASEATINAIKGASAAADALLYGAKAYAAFASFNPWSGAQYTLAAVASAAASAAYFQAAGSGGGGTSSAPSVGGAAAVSAPPAPSRNEGGGETVINVNFDRAARPLTRGDERAVRAGVERAMAGAAGGRGLGARRGA